MIIRRSQWGARAPKQISHDIKPAQGGVALHYEGPKLGTFTHDKCAAKVRGIQAFHMDGRKWADIAYSYMVCPHGYLFECRGVNVRTAAQGTAEGNDYYYAVCVLMGEGDVLTDAAKEGVLEAIHYLRAYGHAGNKVKGHREFHSTGCPGDTIYTWLKGGLQDPHGTHASGSTGSQVLSRYPEPRRVLKKDDKGRDVMWVQDALNTYWQRRALAVDGNYGSDTYDHVLQFQKNRRLKGKDGVTGPETIDALRKVLLASKR